MTHNLLAFFPGGISPMEMLIVGIIALLLFGSRLPEVMRNLGKGITEFKRGMRGIEDEIDSASYRASSSASRPMPQEEREEVLAPKFEPPRLEPAVPDATPPLSPEAVAEQRLESTSAGESHSA